MNCFLQCPQQVEGFSDKEVVKLAAHPDGKHFLALTGDGDVYSWGSGDGGRLGHGDNNSRDEPTLIQALVGKHMVHIACGSTYRFVYILKYLITLFLSHSWPQYKHLLVL